MTAISQVIHLSDYRRPVDDLAASNLELERVQAAAIDRAVDVIHEAIAQGDAHGVGTVIETMNLVPTLAVHVTEAIGDHLSADWGLDIVVDSCTHDELDLSVRGHLHVDQTAPLVAFLVGLSWWPSKVLVMLGSSVAIDTARAADPATALALVRAAVTAHG